MEIIMGNEEKPASNNTKKDISNTLNRDADPSLSEGNNVKNKDAKSSRSNASIGLAIRHKF
jgi:hypothetical protein